MLLEVAVGKGDILILAAISLCPIKHGKAFPVISVWLYFSRQIPSVPCNSCSQCIALGRVLLEKSKPSSLEMRDSILVKQESFSWQKTT